MSNGQLVAKGYTLFYGVYYQETFALVAKLNTVRILLSLTANQDWPLLQFDVKNVFLHGEILEEIYMDSPLGMTNSIGMKVLQIKEGSIWIKTIPKSMVWKVYQVYEGFWL